MSIPIKTAKEIAIMKEGGKILGEVLEKTCKMAKIGVSTWELDQYAEKLIRKHGASPSFKGYNGFPGSICAGIDDVIVHGIPRKEQILKDGDLLTIDCGVFHKGFHTDAARSITIGNASPIKKQLISVGWEAFDKAIAKMKPGVMLDEISEVIGETITSAGFHIIHDLTGHGIGKKLHEAPIVLNYKDRSRGPELKSGMTLAIEPIFSIGTSQMETLPDNWTIVTRDGSASVQVENTVLITENGCEILTKI